MKYAHLIWRNLTRNKVRTALTGGAIALAIALVCLLLTMPAGFDRMLAAASNNTRIGVHAKAGLTYTIPYSYLQKVKSMKGVIDATSYDWFGGAVDVNEGVTFPNFSVDPEAIGKVYADFQIPADVLEAFRKNRDAALVGREIMDRYKWQVGDRITLESTRYGFPLDFRIVGAIDSPSNTGNPELWFPREYLVQTLEARNIPADEMSMLWANVDDAARVDPLMQEIDGLFRTGDVQTASETEQGFAMSFFGMLQGLLTIIMIVTAVVATCIVFIAANTASMAVRERMREIAIYKALGFSRKAIFGTLLAEAVLLSTLAGAAGVALSMAVSSVLSTMPFDRRLGPIMDFVLGPAIVVQGFFLALFIGMLSGWVPSFSAARRGVVVTLREVF